MKSRNELLQDFSRFVERVQKKPTIGLTIAGGGCKAFFGLGVGAVLVQGGIKLNALSGTSAGTAMSLALMSTNPDDLVAEFCELVRKNPSNFYMSDLFSGKTPFPHEKMYRYTVTRHLDMEKLKASKIKLAFNALRIPKHLEPDQNKMKLTAFMAKVVNAFRKEASNNEKGIFEPLMSEVARSEGLKEIIFTNEDLDTPEKVEAIIMASSAAPPVTNIQRLFDGYYYLDGGIINNLPVKPISDESFLIAIYYKQMTRIFFEKSLSEEESEQILNKIFYVYPEGPIPVNTWDYTDPEGVQQTYDMGRRTGEQILRIMNVLR